MSFGQEFATPQLHQIAPWPSGKALDSDSSIIGSNPIGATKYAEIAQLVEQFTRNE